MNLKLKKMVMSIISLSVSMSLIQANASNTLTDDEVEKIESKFSINNYLGDTSNLSETEGYYYKEGRIPVLISAPHSIKQPPRPDSNKDYKSEDKYTGTIAEELAKRTGAHVIYRTGYTGVDDNFPVDSKGNEVYDENGELIKTPYREKIKDIVKNNEIKLVIDLHGFASNDSRDYGVEFGTNYNKNFVGNDDILNIILEEFEKEGFELRTDSSKVPTTKKIVIDKEFTAKVKNRSVSNYTATTLKTPAIQMEFCSENRKNIDDLNDTIDALERVVNGVSKYEYKTANVTAPNFVYFRDKANFQESSIIKKINRGEAVTIISKYNESFYKVKYNGELGYVSSKYLEQRGIIYGIPNFVNLRKEPKLETENNFIKKINVKESVIVLERGKNWTKVEHNGSVGYISSKYLFIGERAKIDNIPNFVNLREEAKNETENNTIKQIDVGETVNIIEKGKYWTKVEHNGSTGYVATKYLTIIL